jgi:hypothetical protein
MDEEVNFGLNRGTFSRGGWIGAVLFVSLFLLIGLGTLAGGVLMARKAGESLSWPKASGQILTSGVINAYTTGNIRIFALAVEYKYAVGDRIYTGNRINDGQFTSSDWQELQKIADRYLPKKTVVVYYDPARPENALLEPGYSSTAWIPFLIGGVFTLVGAGLGLGLVWMWNRPYNPPKPAPRKGRKNAGV